MNKKVSDTQVVWEITRLLQEADSLEEALRISLGEVVKAVGAEAGTIWFYNKQGNGRIYPCGQNGSEINYKSTAYAVLFGFINWDLWNRYSFV